MERVENAVDTNHVDGNAAAGLLAELFALDVTTARARCAGCGTVREIAALMVYQHGMGTVLRCPDCEGVVLRIVRTPTHLWFDATGASSIAVVT